MIISYSISLIVVHFLHLGGFFVSSFFFVFLEPFEALVNRRSLILFEWIQLVIQYFFFSPPHLRFKDFGRPQHLPKVHHMTSHSNANGSDKNKNEILILFSMSKCGGLFFSWLSTAKKENRTLKTLKNNILLSYQTFAQLNY